MKIHDVLLCQKITSGSSMVFDGNPGSYGIYYHSKDKIKINLLDEKNSRHVVPHPLGNPELNNLITDKLSYKLMAEYASLVEESIVLIKKENQIVKFDSSIDDIRVLIEIDTIFSHRDLPFKYRILLNPNNTRFKNAPGVDIYYTYSIDEDMCIGITNCEFSGSVGFFDDGSYGMILWNQPKSIVAVKFV